MHRKTILRRDNRKAQLAPSGSTAIETNLGKLFVETQARGGLGGQKKGGKLQKKKRAEWEKSNALQLVPTGGMG